MRRQEGVGQLELVRPGFEVSGTFRISAIESNDADEFVSRGVGSHKGSKHATEGSDCFATRRVTRSPVIGAGGQGTPDSVVMRPSAPYS